MGSHFAWWLPPGLRRAHRQVHQHLLPTQSIAVVEPNTPIKIANDGPGDLVHFIYCAPIDPSADIIEPASGEVKVVITREDVTWRVAMAHDPVSTRTGQDH